MKLEITRLTKWMLAIAVTAAMPLAHAFATFSNGGFEAGDSPWTFAPAAVVGITPATGNITPGHSLHFKDAVVGNDLHRTFSGSATQTFTFDGTEAGNYHFEFWTKGRLPSQPSTVPLLSPFVVSIVDFAALSFTLGSGSANPGGWTPYFGNVELNVGDHTLSFMVDASALGGTAFDFNIDDVSFTKNPTFCDPANPACGGGPGNVPEPGTLFLLGAALAAGAAVRRKTKA